MTAPSTDELLQAAAEHHDAGRFVDAENLYRQVLQRAPKDADAMHCFGLLCFQQNRSDEALQLLDRAIAAEPDVPEFHATRARILTALGKADGAISAWQKALSLHPDNPAGQLALATLLIQQNRKQEAIDAFRAVIRLNPDDAAAWTQLGHLLLEDKQFEEAAAAWRRVLDFQPGEPRAWNNLGIVLRNLQQDEQAVDAFRKACAAGPGLIDIWCNLTAALRDLRKLDEALEAANRAVEMQPDHSPAHVNLGLVLNDRGQAESAMKCWRRAIELEPNQAEAFNNISILLLEQGRNEQAIENCRKALAIKPDSVEAWNNLGNALRESYRLDQAAEAYRKALALRPRHADAMNNLGNVLMAQGKIEDAIAYFDQAVAIKPNAGTASNRIFAMMMDGRQSAASMLAACRDWDAQYAVGLAREAPTFENERSPERRLRIGYVCSFLRRHIVALNLLPLVARHDHGKFEVYYYSATRLQDDMTKQFKGYADAWRDIHGLSDEATAAMIRRDQVDILVDLALHSSANHLLVFARKPAPVQATFVGYPGTTGLSAMDYRLTDPYLDPPSRFDGDYSERTIRLPSTFWCYEPAMDSTLNGLEVSALPAEANGFVTFGCLNSFSKVNDGSLRLWQKVLHALPSSRLILMAPEGSARQRVLERLGAGGVKSERIDFVDRKPRREYFELYHRIDVSLDPIPYNGHTTALDSLWMGVPTITRMGGTVASRAGFSQLSNIGMAELAADNDEDFVRIAVGLAKDIERMRKLRAELRGRMERSPLMDGEDFARGVESAYRRMWREWCQR